MDEKSFPAHRDEVSGHPCRGRRGRSSPYPCSLGRAEQPLHGVPSPRNGRPSQMQGLPKITPAGLRPA